MTGTYDPSHTRLLTFHDKVASFRDGTDTPRKYLERCLETIEAREPVVRAWVEMNVPGARAAADAASDRYRAGTALSMIDGMPIGIKDLIMTRDMPTRMGSPLFAENHTHADSASVQALRSAGAVVLGKTVTTELGFSHPGPTTNPFSPDHTPGGSSSGSAAAVGAGMIPAAVGSQVAGSIVRPASFCGNFAIKPTLGAINRGERLGTSQSHLGVHAGSLTDMWHVAIEMARRAGGDPGYPGLFGGSDPHAPVRPMRLIVMESQGAAEMSGLAQEVFETFLAHLARQGVEILRRDASPLIERFEQSISDALELTRDLCAYEMRWSLENIIERHGGGLSDSMMARLELARGLSIDHYRACLDRREAARTAHRAIAPLADAMISPSSVGSAPRMDNTQADSGISHTTGLPSYNAATSMLGSPAISLPMLAVDGLPMGLQVIGQPHEDDRLTGLARWISETIPPVSR